MQTFLTILILFIAFEHFLFLILEMFLWETKIGRQVFSNTKTKAKETKVLAANMGLYNGFLSAGLIMSLFFFQDGKNMLMFFLVCIIIAGVYGGFSASKSIFIVQALPSTIGLALLLI